MASRVSAMTLVFDVNETLLDLEVLGSLFQKHEPAPLAGRLHLWSARRDRGFRSSRCRRSAGQR